MEDRFDQEFLTRMAKTILGKAGLDSEQGDALVESVLAADRNGVHSHGLCVLKTYVEKIERGGYQIGVKPEIKKETAAFCVVDAKNTIGAYSASFCMEYAIKRCRDAGIYTVFSRGANTFGPAFYYAQKAIDEKMIGICMSNSPTAMPAWGGKKKILGTNPFAVGIPADKEAPILMDMATSKVAKSKINEARKAGETIPEGWALDADGNPTTDPVAAIEGMVLPMAEHKGYSIALAIDVLSGLLSGAGYLDSVNRFYSPDNQCMNVGQMFVAIDPVQVLSDDFYIMVDEYCRKIHASGEGVLCPGENRWMEEQDSFKNGIALAESTIDNLRELAEKYSVAWE